MEHVLEVHAQLIKHMKILQDDNDQQIKSLRYCRSLLDKCLTNEEKYEQNKAKFKENEAKFKKKRKLNLKKKLKKIKKGS
jgi:hypothetical protein